MAFLIKQIAKIFENGGVIIFPTDTVYGLGCDVFSSSALQKIYRIKNRESGKAFPMLVSGIAMLKKYAVFSKNTEDFILSLRRPTTVVLKAKNLPVLALQNGNGAFRIAKTAFLNELWKKFQHPIIATSVNLSGKEPIIDPRNFIAEFGAHANLIDAVIFAGMRRKKRPSRIIDLTKKPYKIIR